MYNTFEELEESIKGCNKCKLYKTRQNIVFGVGKKMLDLCLLEKDLEQMRIDYGEPFVGKAGKLMNMAFQTLGIKREEVYIANIVKCRPPENRNPEEDECMACMNYLRNQVILVRPEIIVLLR